jgi:hypothetical protein
MKNFIVITLFGFQASAYNFKIVNKTVGAFQIPFVHNAEVEEKTYNLKASFADIENLAPLTTSQLSALKPNDFRNLTMEEFNQIYARIGSGPIPYGDYAGYVMQKPPLYNSIKKRIFKQILLAKQFAELAKTVCGRDGEDCLFEFIWKGKRFGAKNEMDQILAQTIFNPATSGLKGPRLSNLISKFPLLEKTLDFTEGLFDKGAMTMFPMNTYCGLSQVDTRRESIITDAAFGDDFGLPTYIPLRDDVISRKGLNITEEYRMVRPGLYIGKVYTNKLFLFNVVLEKTGTKTPTETANACLDTIKAM